MKYSFIFPWLISKNSPESLIIDKYLKRLEFYVTCDFIFPSTLLKTENMVENFLYKEVGKRVQNKEIIVCFDENGLEQTTVSMSKQISYFKDSGVKGVSFCVGGAYGLPAKISEFGDKIKLWSLSRLTFPHEIALIIILEQIYRVNTYLQGHPYHHEENSKFFQQIMGKSKNK